jgi:hypothetical protein
MIFKSAGSFSLTSSSVPATLVTVSAAPTTADRHGRELKVAPPANVAGNSSSSFCRTALLL